MSVHYFQIYELGVKLSTNHSAIAAAGQQLLRHFPQSQSQVPVQLEIRLNGVGERNEVPLNRDVVEVRRHARLVAVRTKTDVQAVDVDGVVRDEGQELLAL